VVGVIANLAFSFGVILLSAGSLNLAKFDVPAACIVLAAMGLLTRTKLALPFVLVLGLVVGTLMKGI
jgi:hypothetical protein